MQTAPPRVVRAAGAAVLHRGRVLVIHRQRYDDWSLPKGKLEPGEANPVAAVREVWEETGLGIRLGPVLDSVSYPIARGCKEVAFWRGHPVNGVDISHFAPNAEVDAVRWVDVPTALGLLSYAHERRIVEQAVALPDRLQTLIVLRHAQARVRSGWTKPDATRPLTRAGMQRSRRLVPLLAAYGVRHAVTSTSARCVQTLEPWADHTGWPLAKTNDLSEEGASPNSVLNQVEWALERTEPTVLCTHRPVLPTIFDVVRTYPATGGVIGQNSGEHGNQVRDSKLAQLKLAPGELVVIHHQLGKLIGEPEIGSVL